MHLDESSKIPMFQSFLCRSFTASYYGRATIHGFLHTRGSIRNIKYYWKSINLWKIIFLGSQDSYILRNIFLFSSSNQILGKNVFYSFRFTVPAEEYDTTLELNKGFRYKNIEHRNYYPDWPNCPRLDWNFSSYLLFLAIIHLIAWLKHKWIVICHRTTATIAAMEVTSMGITDYLPVFYPWLVIQVEKIDRNMLILKLFYSDLFLKSILPVSRQRRC